MNSEAPSTPTRDEFCLALKAARERRGVTLAEIAEATKIPASHFADLERNDLRHWPKGLFRRSFFRDYVRKIGVPVDEACAEFARLFPDEEAASPAVSVESTQPSLPSMLRRVPRRLAATWRHAVDAMAHLFDASGDERPEPERETPSRPWVTDARRVGPKTRIRVRIKLPH